MCWAVVAALLHELGHWAAARLAGAPVPRVVIGTGPRLVAFRWAGTLWDVHRYPVAGQARAALVAPRLARTKLVAIVAAGPLANAALLALCAAGGGATWLVAGAWANALHLGLSLFPWRCRSPQGPVLSDGLQIALLPRLSTAALHERLAAGHRAISLELCLAGD
ncbi:MAG: site-2 protease family protein, partial [Acidobacteria bacterium]|nr:site-2 protease family protein [Acidobacteriota bacterium]